MTREPNLRGTRTPGPLARAGRIGAGAALAILVGACGGSTADTDTTQPESTGWPSELVTGEGAGPALYLSEAADAPAIGFVSPGVVVRLGGAPSGDRVRVRIDGALKVRGWLGLSRLAARVTQRGKVRGTPTAVAPNQIVGVRGLASEGILRVEVRPFLGRADAPTLGPFIGEYPVTRLGAREVPAEAADAERGEPHHLQPGVEVPLYARPGGDVVATLPALDPPLDVELVRASGEWKAVRVGMGPYLVGYVNAELVPGAAVAGTLSATPEASTGLPERLAAEGTRPLFRVRSGARVRFNADVIAILQEDGWARELNRYETGEVDVFVAVNDQVAVRGMLRAEDLSPAEPPAGGETPPATPPDATTPPDTSTPPAPDAAAPAPTPAPGTAPTPTP